ncbi:MAG: TPM domain-containing protein [Bacteroidia bacterium]|nr:TPM domain-containing protein [Bacteroidia bacterium]
MKGFLSFLLFFITWINLSAQNFPEKEKKLVYDLAGVLDNNQLSSLETKLRYYNDSTSTNISIVIIPGLEGYEIADYANQLARKWGVGQKGKNNGILLLAAINDRKFRIEVGYGLEPVITDAISKRIITEIIKPNFKEGKYYEGLDEATDKIVLALKGEFKSSKKKKGDTKTAIAITLIFLFILLVFFISFGRKAKQLALKNNIPFWAAWSLLNAMSNNRGRWNDFSGGGGSFGGGSSSGGGGIDFDGFGGGDFGGGGASGDW